MNMWQLLRQVRYLLLSRSWTGSSNRVFGRGSVIVSAYLPKQVKSVVRVPFAMVYPLAATSDPEHGEEPDLLQQGIGITLGVAIPGDAVGEKPLIGGNVPDRTLSEGRGVTEIEEELFAAIARLTTDLGVVIAAHAQSAARVVIDDDFGYVALRDYTWQTWTIATRFYHPAFKLTATGGSGQVTLAWGVPPDRYDRFRVVLRRNSGGTIPASVTAGTGVTLSGNLATSVTDSGLSAGTYSYALFAQYDETNDLGNGDALSAADRTSASVSRQSVSVT